MSDDPHGKIFPRNLTARAAYAVVGNPSVSRPEDAVANCYPGLELDVRNLDRRFFPGLVFNFVARNDVGAPYSHPEIYGARLAYVDADQDPDLNRDTDCARALNDALQGNAGALLRSGIWYIDWIEQCGRRLVMSSTDDQGVAHPLDGLFVWRLVRSLEPQELVLGLIQRRSDDGAEERRRLKLHGWRRRFTDSETGVISAAFQPGELTEGLCSPWQHDFRDCYCNYWASNHPDVVHGEILPGEEVLPNGQAADPERAQVLLDWLRRDRSRSLAAGAHTTFSKNRPFQYDHFEINRAWQDLAFVLGGTELSGAFSPDEIEQATPYASPAELADALRTELAPLEMTLALEYVYAYLSLLSPEEAEAVNAAGGRWQTLADDVTFARHYLMLTAASEMQHLRWDNELLWHLHNAGLVPGYAPVLVQAERVPSEPGKTRPHSLRPLTPETLEDFVRVEQPSGRIDGCYARVIVTLADPIYPAGMRQIAGRIVNDGMEHYSRFRDMRSLFRTYNGVEPAPYLRPIRPGTRDEAKLALDLFISILDSLNQAYSPGAWGNMPVQGAWVAQSRVAMHDLLALGENLAKQGIGIPFWPWPPADLPE